MHCLEVIVKRNNDAAAREEGHAVNDHQFVRAALIMDASKTDGDLRAAHGAYFRARKDG